jgi:hypothetical protein
VDPRPQKRLEMASDEQLIMMRLPSSEFPINLDKNRPLCVCPGGPLEHPILKREYFCDKSAFGSTRCAVLELRAPAVDTV